ncbi:MAG: ABC transporter substrate-binding protein [Candidatus Methanomethylicia archaeon]
MKISIVTMSIYFMICAIFLQLNFVRAQEQPIISFTCTVPIGYDKEYAAMLIIKDSLAKHGIEMNIVREDAGTFFAKIWGAETFRLTYEEGGFDADSYWWYWRPEDMLFFSSFTAKGFPPEGWNEWSYNNDYAADMLDAALRTYDINERKEYYRKFTEEFQRDPPFIPLYYFEIPKAARADIENYDPIQYIGQNAFDWKVKGKTYDDYVTIRVAVPYTENYIDPLFGMTSSLPQYACIAPVFPNLLRSEKQPDGTYTLVPDLAESYDISGDGLTITFHLRRNIFWSDGKPFTADDVKVTYEGMLNPNTGIPALADLREIRSIETPDDYTVIFHLRRPHALILVTFGGYCTGGIVPAHIFGKIPYEQWRGYWTDPSQVVSLGAYKIVEFVPNTRYVLEANPNYWRGKPFVDRIEVVIIPETATAISALKKGEVDILVPEYAGPELLAELSSLEAAGIDMSFVLWPATSYLGFNLNHPVLNNRYVRLAIANLIPIDTIINDVLKGHGRPANGPIYPGSWAYPSDIPPLAKYDPEKAMEYLKKAGYIRPQVMTATMYIYMGAMLIIGIVIGFATGLIIFKRKYKK